MLCDITYSNASFIIHTEAARDLIYDNDIVRSGTAIPLLYTANMTACWLEVESREFAKEMVKNLTSHIKANVRRAVTPHASRRGVRIPMVEVKDYNSCPVRLTQSRGDDYDPNAIKIVFADGSLGWKD